MSRSLLDHPLISSRYFFPRRTPPRDHGDHARGARLDVAVDGARLACYLRAPHPGALTVVHFHGNGEVVADWQGSFEEALIGMGVNLMLAEYRGYGASTGQPGLGSMLDDVPAVLEACGAPVDRLVFMGRSVGAVAAVEAAARCPGARGLVLESGVASALERILLRVAPAELGVTQPAMAAAFAARLDHARKLATWRGGTLLLHARHDSMVSAEHALRHHRWVGERATLVLFDQGDHNDLLFVNERAYMAALERFLRALDAVSD